MQTQQSGDMGVALSLGFRVFAQPLKLNISLTGGPYNPNSRLETFIDEPHEHKFWLKLEAL